MNVDWRQLNRWGISEKDVPADAIVYFREPSLWETYPSELIIAAIVFLLLMALVIGLIVERQRRRHAELAEAKNRSEVVRAMRIALAGQLSGSIAHELNQPLGAILNNVAAADLVLESGANRRDELRAILSDIRRDNQRASEVIRHLRSLFAQHENEQRPFRLDDAMSDVTNLLVAEAERRGDYSQIPTRAKQYHRFGRQDRDRAGAYQSGPQRYGCGGEGVWGSAFGPDTY